MNSLEVVAEDGGWLVSTVEAPIGYIDAGGAVMTPSGATYAVRSEKGSFVLESPDGQSQAILADSTIRDVKTGVEWRIREGWESAFLNGGLDIDSIWALPYTLEDAQGTVPNRVRLLLAWVLTQTSRTQADSVLDNG